MSKQITAHELAEIVQRLLTGDPNSGELDEFNAYQGFMSDIAQVVCDYCGGEIRNPATPLDETWYVGIYANDSVPKSGGIWKNYDPDCEDFTG